MTISTPAKGISARNVMLETEIALADLLANYPAATNSGRQAMVTDVGMHPVPMVSNGVEYVPLGGVCTVDRMEGVPVVKAPSFTGTTNGAITLTTAVDTVFDSCFMYFDTNTVNASQPAGFYYTTMSSTSAAIVYNNTYTPAVGVYPAIPASPTAFSGAVPSGAGVTTAVTAFKYEIKANSLGMNGASQLKMYVESSAVDTKTMALMVNGQTMHSQSISGTNKGIYAENFFRNLGVTNNQRAMGSFSNASAAVNSARTTTLDTTTDLEASVTLRSTNSALDWVALTYCTVALEK